MTLSDFLKLALNYNLTDYIEQAQGGVELAHITKAKLDQSFLVHPPLPVQRAIADLVARSEMLRDSATTGSGTPEGQLKVFGGLS